MYLAIDASVGTFYSIGQGYALFTEIMKPGELSLGESIPLKCMFQGFELLSGGRRIGYYFESTFKSKNHGGYIVASLSNKGPAETVEVILKIKDLLVCYHYPNRGTLIISPTIGDDTQVIFEEQ
jgi:hypothetical protein